MLDLKKYADLSPSGIDDPTKDVLFVRDKNGHVVDVLLRTTALERYNFLKKFPNKVISNEESSSGFILSNTLAKYSHHEAYRHTRPVVKRMKRIYTRLVNAVSYKQTLADVPVKMERLTQALDEITQKIAKLECFLNKIDVDIDELLKAVKTYKKEIIGEEKVAPGVIDNYLITFTDQPEYQKEFLKLKVKLAEKCDTFITNIETLQKQGSTGNQRRKMVSGQNGSADLQSLGDFINRQLTSTIEAGIQQGYSIENHRFPTPTIVQELSNAKSAIAEKNSLYGRNALNTHSTVPESMLVRMTPPDVAAGCITSFTSIKDYVDGVDNIKEVNKVLRYFAQSPAESARPRGYWESLKKTARDSREFLGYGLGVGIELAMLAIRFGTTVLVFFPIAPIVWLFSKSSLHAVAEQCEHVIGTVHRFLSPFRWLKAATNRYNLAKIVGSTEDKSVINTDKEARKQLLTEICLGKERSRFSELFNHHIGAHKLYEYAGSAVNSVGRWFVTDSRRNASYLLGSGDPLEAFIRIQTRVKKAQAFKETLKGLQLPTVTKIPVLETNIDDKLIQKVLVAETKDHQPLIEEKELPSLAPAVVIFSEEAYERNKLTLPPDFFKMISYGLSKLLADPAFRNSPLLASVLASGSLISLATLMVPALVSGGFGGAKIHAFLQFMKEVPVVLSKHMTGKELLDPHEGGLFSKMIATFLEWKLPLFAIKGVEAVVVGNLNVIEEFSQNPEMVTAGLLYCISLGMVMSYIPEIPSLPPIAGVTVGNPYSWLINEFTNESRLSDAGTPGLTGLEKIFLAAKLTALSIDAVRGGKAVYPGLNIDKLQPEDFLSKLEEENYLAKDEATRRGILDKVLNVSGFSKKEHRQLIIDDVMKDMVQDLERAKRVMTDPTFKTLQGRYNALDTKVTEVSHTILARKQLPEAKSTNADLEASWAALAEAIDVIVLMKETQTAFNGDTTEAQLVYQHAEQCFDEHNKQLGLAGLSNKKIDKGFYLPGLYNMTIYTGSPTLLRMLTMVPGYPLTLAWRGIKYAIAHARGRSATKEQVRKSFSKDYLTLIDVGLVIGLVVEVGLRAVSYVARLALGAVTGVLWGAAKILSLIAAKIADVVTSGVAAAVNWGFATQFKGSQYVEAVRKDFAALYDFGVRALQKITPYRWDGINQSALGRSYGNAARIASGNETVARFKTLQTQLAKDTPNELLKIEGSEAAIITTIRMQLGACEREQQGKFFGPDPKVLKKVEQFATMWSNTATDSTAKRDATQRWKDGMGFFNRGSQFAQCVNTIQAAAEPKIQIV